MMNPRNMCQFLDAVEAQYQGRTLLTYMNGSQVYTVSAAAFFCDVRRYAAMLVSQGLCGKHIGLIGTNQVAWLAAFCAVYQVGAVAVLLSPDLSPQELSERVRQADIAGLFFDDTRQETVRQIALSASFIPMNFDALEGATECVPILPEPDESELACILFTSGTTATAKAVMLSQKAMVAGVCHNVIRYSFQSQLAILPFHHIAGIASVLNTWYLNATVCIGQDFKYLYRYLSGMKPDYMLTVPSILQAIVKKLQNGGPNGQLFGWNLQLLGCGGAKFQGDVIQFLNDHGIRVLQSYGATEAGGLGFDWEMTPDCADTIGKPCPEIETKIVDGELYLRSPSVMMGYYGDPEATAEVLQDGWYATGDLCYQDAAGYLHLTGRKNNLIILANGENVSPEEMESRLQTCPAIGEVLVEVIDNLITATVYPNLPTACTEAQKTALQQEIQQAVTAYNSHVPLYKQVQRLQFTDSPLEKTANGKLVRSNRTGGL